MWNQILLWGRGINICLVPTESSRYFFLHLFLFLWQSCKLDSLYIFSFSDLEQSQVTHLSKETQLRSDTRGLNLDLLHVKPKVIRNGKCKYSKPLPVLGLTLVLTIWEWLEKSMLKYLQFCWNEFLLLEVRC